MTQEQFFDLWLILDSIVDHDGDAPVTEYEQAQWWIERQLMYKYGLNIGFDIQTLDYLLVREETSL